MTTHITKTWFDGEKLVTQEIAESEVYKQEPPVQFKCTVVDDQHPNGVPLSQWGTTPATQRQWVGLTDEERTGIREWQKIQDELGPVWAPMMLYLYMAIEQRLKEKNHG